MQRRERKGKLGALHSVSLGCSFFLLLEEVFSLVPELIRPQSTNARKPQSQGRCLSAQSHVARGSARPGEQESSSPRARSYRIRPGAATAGMRGY